MILVMNLTEDEIPIKEDTSLIWYITAFSMFVSVLLQKQGIIAYYRGLAIGIILAIIGITVSFIIVLLSPKHPKSLWNTKYGAKLMLIGTGSHMEIRINGKSKQKGQGIVVVNHQSFIDIIGTSHIFEYYGESVVTVKKEIKTYFIPLGIIVGRPGGIFVDRKDKNAASSLANQAVSFFKKYKDGKIIIYPEGTRNDSDTFLPFKKGAFRLAINNQVPIYPCVVSPYYFIKKNQYFKGGQIIISLLDPIDTTGMTEKDTDLLIEKTRNIMMDEFKKLGEELKNLELH